MKLFSKKLLASTTLALGIFGVFASTVYASEKVEPKVINEQWGNPTLILGGALNKEQQDKTIDFLEVEDMNQVETYKVSGKDMVQFLGSGNESANMYSSALITPLKDSKDNGVVVQIVTPNNITKVTTTQYTNALITAGATGVSVKIASPVSVTGESALTGIYKAYNKNGQELDTDRMKVAQNELDTVSDIVSSNENAEKFKEETLDKAMIEIKQKIAEATDNGENPIEQKIASEIVHEVIKANGLGDFVTQEQTDKLVDFAFNYSKTSAVSSEEVKEQLNNLTSEVKQNLENAYNTIKDEGFWQKVGDFFTDIFNSIANLFK